MKTFLLRCIRVVLASLALFLAIAIIATWAPDQPLQELKPRWAEPPSRFIEADGLQVHVRDEGPHDDPAPIVLLHGTSASLHTWQGWTRELRDRRRVIRFDLPGFGLTGPRPDHDYSVQSDVRMVRAVLDRLEVKRAVLAGNSLGGQVAWSAAAAMPDRVERLILVDSAGYRFDTLAHPPEIPLGFRIARMPAVRWLGNYVLPRGLIERSLHNVYGDPSKITQELVDQYMAMALREGNREALARRMDQGYTADPAQLKSITAPTLVLWGGKDRLTPLQFGQWFIRDIPGSRLVVFDDLGHVPHEEDPLRTVGEVKRFLGL